MQKHLQLKLFHTFEQLCKPDLEYYGAFECYYLKV